MASGSIRHRIEGVLSLGVSGVLVWLVFVTRTITPKILYLIPVTASIGLWFIAFGYPTNEEGVAPRWWRIGLVATTALFFAIVATWLWN